jgi:hypothetical protein
LLKVQNFGFSRSGMQPVIIDEPAIDPSAADQASGRHYPDALFQG